MTFLVKTKATAHAKIYRKLRDKIGAWRATQWLFLACDDLDGMSPVQAIKAGRGHEVRMLADVIVKSGLIDEQ